MNRRLLLALFVFLYAAEILRLNLSLAPGLSAKNAFLYLAMAAVAGQVVVTQRRLELVNVLAPFTLYVAYATFMYAAAILVVDYPGYRWWGSFISLKNGPMEDLLVLLVFFFGLAGIKQPLAVLRGALWLIMVGNVITVLDVMNIVNLGLIDMESDGRAAGVFGHPNQFAVFMAFVLPLIAALYWTESGYRKLFVGMGLVVSALAFMLAVSRAGIAGLVAGALLSAILLHNLVPAKLVVRTGFAIAGFTVVALIGLTVAGYSELMFERLFLKLEGDAGHATSGRTVIWARLLGTMLEHPMSFITGFGWNAYRTDLAMGVYRLAPHSTYLGILYDLGVIGLALFLTIAANVVRTIRSAIAEGDSQARPFLIGFMAGFLGLLVALSFDELYMTSLYVWAIAGAALRIAVSVQAPEPASIPLREYRAPLPYRTPPIQFPRRLPHDGGA